MGFRFRKSFKIAPGVRMNVGKNGVSSFSFGGKGTTLNVGGKRGARATFRACQGSVVHDRRSAAGPSLRLSRHARPSG